MTIPTKALPNGFSMPVYGLGTWEMGGRKERDEANDDDADRRAIATALDRGVRHIDTAESYAGGYAETLIGQVIADKERDSLFIATKVSARHAAHEDVIKSCEASLKRLGVEYVDLYMLHSYSPTVSLAETMDAMNELAERDLIKSLGVSNFGPENLSEAQAQSTHPIVVNQVHYSVQIREAEAKGLLDHCTRNHVLLCAWRPLNYEAPTRNILQDVGTRYDKTERQVALNWLISQANVVTISKTRNPDHLDENLGACGWSLDYEDIELIRRDFPYQLDVSPVVELDG